MALCLALFPMLSPLMLPDTLDLIKFEKRTLKKKKSFLKVVNTLSAKTITSQGMY